MSFSSSITSRPIVESSVKEKMQQQIVRPSIGYWYDAWLRLQKNKVAIASLFFIAAVSLMAITVPPLLPYDYEVQEIWNKHSSSSLGERAVVHDRIEYKPKIADASLESNGLIGSTLDAPQGVRLRQPATTQQVVIEWDQVAGATQYQIYRASAKNVMGLPLAELKADQLSFQDIANLETNKVYYYRVTALNSVSESESSQVLEVRPILSLSIQDAAKFSSGVQPGDVVKTWPHLLGTDYLGRDNLARILTGTRISLGIGLLAPALFVLIGIIYGCVAGYFGGLIDNIMMRFADILVTIPNLLILIMLQVVMGSGPVTLVFALVISDWAGVSQQVRGEVLRIREMEFIQAAELLGTSFPKLIFKHLLPNAMGTILILFSLAIPRVIFTEAFLSFIGLGIAPPLPSLGSVTREGAEVMATHPEALIYPAVLLSLLVLAFNLLGDGLRDALDPKQRGRA